ncbi:hypothetical protein D1093_09550 [Bartonella kosoyi]|uniref:Uncharacterized protein n=1 Tax=Bartonella kosoyi TaxID=2133959 RepID=A0A5B9CYR5_9HYPH|nr:hypothetical protein [Bartonella kosoyi]QEE09792.1 hypothetical protein D1093_09550 [Bartonella kosoyi]
MKDILVVFSWGVELMLFTLLSALCTMFILALCCSAFKRVRLYCQVRKELRRVLKEPVAFEPPSGETPMLKPSFEENASNAFSLADEEILTMESATALLKSLGGRIEIDEKGDYLATFFLPDREVQFLYNAEKGYPQFDCAIAVVSGIHAAACQTIDPYNSGGLIALELSFDVKGLEIFEEKVSAGRLRHALERALEKAMRDVDLSNMLRSQYRTFPWENEIVVPQLTPYSLRYLAALALLGDVETLHAYHKSFIEGERLGFETSIKEEHLARAMVIAQAVEKAKQPSYDLLQQAAKTYSLEVESYEYFRATDPDLCNRRRFIYENLIEEKRQELRQQGYTVYEKDTVYEVDGKNVRPHILYMKDGEVRYMDVKIGINEKNY